MALAVHAAVTVLLILHSAAYLGMAVARARLGPARDPPPSRTAPWPRITVQVAVRDEPGSMLGCMEAVGKLNYPPHLLQIQLVDDSRDPDPGRRAVEALRSIGVDARHEHRSVARGAKAGALQDAMANATGEWFVPFDADFRPAPDFLARLAAHMAPGIACVQARWSTRNPRGSWLTPALDLAMDGHFHVEQRMRAHVGGLMSFNATACAWRRAAIEDVGGWPEATLTEDLDLATRVRLRAGRFVYLEETHCPAELPETVSALAVQQARWARGSLHTARLHLRAVLQSPAVARRRRPGVHFHLLHYSMQPLVVALFATQALVVLIVPVPLWYAVVPPLVLAAGPLAMYAVAVKASHGAGARRLLHLGVLGLVGLGLAPRLAGAAIAGWRTRRGEFRVTPKGGAGARGAGHRGPAVVMAALVVAWAAAAWPLGHPLALGVAAFGVSCAVVGLSR